jgi:hypothetical protein
MTMNSQKTIAALGALLLSVLLPARAWADCGGGLDSLKPAHLSQEAAPRVVGGNDLDQQSDSRVVQPTIIGLWSVTLTSGGAVIDIGYDAWHGDGTETLNDASPVSHNVCLGVWKQTGSRTYQLKHPALRFDAAGNVIGTLILRETNLVNRTGDRFTGTFTIEFFDPSGNSIFTGAGEIAGERITVD